MKKIIVVLLLLILLTVPVFVSAQAITSSRQSVAQLKQQLIDGVAGELQQGINAKAPIDKIVIGTKEICSDSDGEDYYTRGVLAWNGHTYTDYCSYDNKNVVEYVCDGVFQGAPPTITYVCPNGCLNGACIK